MKGGNGQVWIRVPMNNQNKALALKNDQCHMSYEEKTNSSTINGEDLDNKCTPLTEQSSTDDLNLDCDTWEWWDVFRGCANTEKRLFLALSLDKELPDELRLERWLGEPVKALILSTGLFLTNKRGCPVLPRAVQAVVKRFIPLKVQYIIEGRSLGHDMQLYQQYMDHLVDQYYKETTPDPLKNFASGLFVLPEYVSN